MSPPVANRPPEVTHHLPRHPGADHHNAVLAAARVRVDELEPKLAAALEPILRRVGDEAARRFKQFATHHASLHAAGPLTGVKPTSTMICVRPRPEEAAAVADPDGAPASDLHCTLAFLGEVEGSLEPIREAVAAVAGSHGPLSGSVAGYGEFRPPDCGVLLPDVPGLVELRCAVTAALVTAGINYSRDHGFQPHITIDGDPEDGEIDFMLERASQSPLHFDALLIVRGDTETLELPLVGPRPVTAAGDTPPDWTPPAADELVDTDALAAAFRGKTDPIRLALIEDVLGSVFGTPGVTEEEAIAFYHSPKAFELNEALRSGRALTAEQQQAVNALDKAMAPSEEDMVLWRGYPDANAVFKGDIADSTFRTPGYLSTSETQETADTFAGGIAGPPGAAAEPATVQVTNEDEWRSLKVEARELRASENAGNAGRLIQGAIRNFDPEDPSARLYIIRDDAGKLRGAYSYYIQADKVGDGQIGSLADGGGRALMRNAARDAVAKGLPLEVSPVGDSQGFYLKLGFERGDAGHWTLTGDKLGELAAAPPPAGDAPIVLRIDVPKGTPMLRIPPGDFGNQEEWLLPRDVRLGIGEVSTYDDPFGGRTMEAQATALNKGTLSPSTAGVAEGAGLSFDVANPLIDGLLAKTGQHITGIADTTQANVMRAVGSAYQSGLTIPDTAKLITQVMHEAAGPRSVMIARTEMTSAVNGASLAAAQLVGEHTGAKMTKTWLTAPGAQYPRHEEYDGLDGQTVGQDETFTVGEDELQYPGDPDGSPEEVINCRCAMTYSDGSEVEAE